MRRSAGWSIAVAPVAAFVLATFLLIGDPARPAPPARDAPHARDASQARRADPVSGPSLDPAVGAPETPVGTADVSVPAAVAPVASTLSLVGRVQTFDEVGLPDATVQVRGSFLDPVSGQPFEGEWTGTTGPDGRWRWTRAGSTASRWRTAAPTAPRRRGTCARRSASRCS